MPETRGLCLSEEQTVNTVSSPLSWSWLMEFKKLIVCTALNAILSYEISQVLQGKNISPKDLTILINLLYDGDKT